MDYSNQQTESLIFDGAIGVPTAVIVGGLLVVFTTWLLMRDRKAIGALWAAVFWCTRIAAIALAVWMAVGPTTEKVERTSTPQSIAIIADNSESTGVVEPPDGE